MTVLWMGGEMPSFLPSESGAGESSSNNGVLGSYDSAFARCSINTINGTTEWMDSQEWASEAEVWFHGEVMQSSLGIGSDAAILTFADGVDAVVRVLKFTDDTWYLQYLNNIAVWTTAGTENIIGSRQTIDIQIDITNGELRLYVAGTKRMEATGLSLGHITGITRARFNSNYYMFWSQCVTATVPTIGYRLFTVPLSGAGATSSWTGTYANIDEIAYSDADFINSATNGQVSTFAVSNPALTGYTVQAVGVYARAKCGGGGPQNLQLALRSAGADYFSSSQGLDVGYEPHGNIWETDPATSSAWVNAAVLLLQPGVKAIT